MRSIQLPYTLEDRSGLLSASDYGDIYDRLFLRVAPHPQQPERNVWAIYNMGRRSSRHGDSRHFDKHPAVVLVFGKDGELGDIHFVQPPASSSVPMSKYLRKTTLFGGSLSRKFKGSDGGEYRWIYQTVDNHEWSCLNGENYLVAHFDLKPPNIPVYGVSGNTLTVHEGFAHLVIEILASLTIMRYIAEHRL
ncbi:hypothetical protein SERLA73DRAFT_82221 [Serpula lacrymans var. lacrymans S7.3]|uniref:Uncharacterized protein n=2 Tax=Serpula lacrymans var. lacrymans TaxID=341189 RepID=F8PEV2_SERL3|nr:uncharacterized protein SERLADRAFT_444230 [Serpula lacrymans var. lacrymans S7.9]EGO04163.1 hypothetical protein SERLA73DRAFT_82221 [Serpula lacrymans var. lacrymans S7.3]EGO30109.1 hypothetical protein SERLADRAFT_444230 [Serpula lacrymans var. lacrymans S7.9]